MRLNIVEDALWEETEVTIRCREADREVLAMAASLRAFEKKLTGEREGETYLLDAGEVLYADTADKKTFLYTENGVYETLLRLYELEERLGGSDFFRASKSLVVNFRKIKALRPEFGGRMLLTMQGGERCLVSRQYVPVIKEKLGLSEGSHIK